MTINSVPQNSSFLVYGNILINDQLKFEALKYTLPQWANYWKSPVFLRVRGEYSEAVADFCANMENVECVQGAAYRQWRMQTWWDLRRKDSRFVMLFLEDHMLAKSPPDSSVLLQELVAHEVKVFQYSWNAQYQKISRYVQDALGSTNDLGVYLPLSRQNRNEILKIDTRCFISMTSVFEVDFFLRILKSSRPFVRKLDPRAPYSLEQKPESTWYLPIVFGVSKSELGICIDDDNTIAGSSAISRGLYLGDRSPRGENHHAKASLMSLAWKGKEKLYGKSSIPFIPLSLKMFLTRFISWPTYFSYSIQFLVLKFMDSLTRRRMEKIDI